MSRSRDYNEPPPDYSDSENELQSNVILVPNALQSETQTKTSLHALHTDRCSSQQLMAQSLRSAGDGRLSLVTSGKQVEMNWHELQQKMKSDLPDKVMQPEPTSCTTVSFSTADGHRDDVGAASRPRRSLSVKSVFLGEDRGTVDRMKPIINEFRFYQKTQKNILGQKSELQRAIEKRQARQRLKHAEVEKTGLEKILEMRALRISSCNASKQSVDSVSPAYSPSLNSGTIWNKRFENSVKPSASLLPANEVKAATAAGSATCHTSEMVQGNEGHRRSFVKITATPDSHGGHGKTQTSGEAPREKVSQVRLLLKTIESNHLNRNLEKTTKLKEQTGKYTAKQFDYSGRSWIAGGSSTSSLSPSSSSSSTCSSGRILKL